MTDVSHAHAAQRWLPEPWDGDQQIKDRLLNQFHDTLNGRTVLTGPFFCACTFYEERVNPDKSKYQVQKNYITWVAKTTNYNGES